MYRPRPKIASLPPNVPAVFSRRAALIAAGATAREITSAVRAGALIRARRDRYLPSDVHPDVSHAVRLGGRLDCTSLLALYGVFVLDDARIHVRVDPHATRLAPVPAAVRHWLESEAADDDVLTTVVEALVQAVLCQRPRAAVATLDSAAHLGIVDGADLAEVFRRLPRRYRRLRGLLDHRAESGTETLVRLMLRGIGVSPELQVGIPGVGFVDLLVDGWLIIECDSAAHHGDWRQRLKDLRRDAAALAQGYVTLRLPAEDILYHPEEVLALLKRVVEGRPFAGWRP